MKNAVYGTRKGQGRPVPLNPPKPEASTPVRAESMTDDSYAAHCAAYAAAYERELARYRLLEPVQVVVTNRGRKAAIKIQAKAAEIEKTEGYAAASEYIVRETVLGVLGYVVGVDADAHDDLLELAPGIDVELLLEELDGQHLLELVATAGLTGQAPGQSQISF